MKALEIKIKEAGGEFYSFDTKGEAKDFLFSMICKELSKKEIRKRKIIWHNEKFLSEEEKGIFIQKLKEKGISLCFSLEKGFLKEVTIGINEPDFVLLETGSLVEIDNGVSKRACSLFPEIHIALVSPEKVVGTMEELFTLIDFQKVGYACFITGPSKTADIEKVLTTGVHGPEKLIVFYVRESF